MAEEEEDKIAPLTLSKSSRRKTLKSRSNSVPAIDLKKLEEVYDENKDKEEEDLSNERDIGGIKSSLNVSAFSKDPIKFSEELCLMIETIKNQNDLPPKQIIFGLLDILNFWISNHGIRGLNELKRCEDGYDSMKEEYDKKIMIFQSEIEEYKNECIEYKKRNESLDGEQMELTAKLNDATQQLQTTKYLQEQINSIQEVLDQKTMENTSLKNKVIIQQKNINQLKTEKMQSTKIIDSQKIKLSKMTAIDNELKNKMIEIKEINKKYKENEKKLKKLQIEKDQLFQEKKLIQNKLTDYGKLKDNLSQLKLNENDYQSQIERLKNKINEFKQYKEIQESQTNLLKIDDVEQIKINENEHDDDDDDDDDEQITFVDFSDPVHTYNMTQNSYETKGRIDIITDIKPKIDEELKEFDIDIDDINNDKNRNRKESMFGYNMLYRSFVIVGVSCLCWFIYSKYNDSNARQIREKYRKWQNSLNAAQKKQKLRK